MALQLIKSATSIYQIVTAAIKFVCGVTERRQEYRRKLVMERNIYYRLSQDISGLLPKEKLLKELVEEFFY